MLALFEHLALDWGRELPGGTELELPLTHGLLADLACAQRSSVTVALGHLCCRGTLRRTARGRWLLPRPVAAVTPAAGARVDRKSVV